MALFYTNENFPIQVALYLREIGHDVLTSYEAGNANQRIPDAEVLRFAAQAGRILLTINRRDFIKIHEKSARHAGVIVCTQNIDLREQAEQIDLAIKETGDMTGKLIRINRRQKEDSNQY
jgi:hypothetical protein